MRLSPPHHTSPDRGPHAVEPDGARRELPAPERHDHAVLEAIGAGVLVLDPRGAVTACNEAATRMLGVARAELVGATIDELPWTELRGATEEREPAAWLASAIASAQADALLGFRAPGRPAAWHAVSVRRLDRGDEPPGAVLSFADVTGPVERDEADRAAAARFRGAFLRAPIGMAITAVGPAGVRRLIQVNPAMCRIAGRTEEQLIGSDPDALLHPDDAAIDAAQWQRLVDGDLDAYEVTKRAVRPDGSIAWWLLDVSLMRDARDGSVQRITQVQDITARRRFEDRLRRLADEDALTGLLNRHRLVSEIELRIEAASPHRPEGALLLVGLDHFRHVNDSVGLALGDALLVAVAAALRERFGTAAPVARVAGDQFAVLLDGCDPAAARATGEQVLALVRRHATVVGGATLRLTAGAGLVMLDALGDVTGEAALAAACVALYEAKDAGPSRLAVYRPGTTRHDETRDALAWLERARHALAGSGLELYLQPILDLRSGDTSHCEVLLRMRTPDGGIVGPGAFLPAAERFGLITEIDRWVIRHTADLLASLEGTGLPRRVLAVNLSASSVTDPGMPGFIEGEIKRTGVDPTLLSFEITETAAIANVSDAQALASRLARLGCPLALDDFGAGFSSFSYVKHLPVDIVKIDGDFVHDLPRSPRDQLMVRSLVDVAGGLGKETIAEFAEDDETLELLGELGVDYAQGDAVGVPEPARAVLERWAREETAAAA
jgi:diguanylate cyclase (GGDEF)-like protein/PAS domain S-box-containing protein